MLNRKKIKNLIVEDQVKEDKELVLNSLKDKLDLQLKDEKQNKFNTLLKPLVAFACAVIVCVAGYFTYLTLAHNSYKNQFYKWKDVSSLNLKDGEYCLAYSNKISEKEIEIINEKFGIDISFNKYRNVYIIDDLETKKIILNDKNNNFSEYNIDFNSHNLLLKYNDKYNICMDIEKLNDNYNGLLFEFKEDYIEFYTIKNKEKLSIFVEY